MRTFKIWVHGFFAAVISSAASAASGAVMLPTVFSLNKVGFINMGKLAAVPALLAAFAYLKTCPVWQLEEK